MSLSSHLSSTETVSLFSDLKKEGLLVDVYSQEWFDTRQENGDFPRCLLSNLEDEYSPEYFNHLLIIYLDQYKDGYYDRLVSAIPCLGAIINDSHHKPDFLFINLKVNKILCIGLGRKNRIFVIDGETNNSVNAFGITSGDEEFMDEFTKYDHLEVVNDFVNALDSLGEAFFAFDSLPSNPDEIYGALQSEPDEEGYYHLDWDDESYTREDLEGFLAEQDQQLEIMRECENIIHIFFPDAEELNTGDY
jgi:hypothetical protein